MIQRIQSVFLLCAAVATGLMFVMPAATLTVPGEQVYEYYTSKVIQVGGAPQFVTWNWASLFLNILMTALSVITIFLKKKGKSVRPTLLLQLRMCFVNIVLMLGMIALLWLQVRQVAGAVRATWTADTAFIFPTVGIIFTWLAIRSIVKDLTLLKSYDRIR